MSHTIRRARADEAPRLMAFIDQHWKAGHPLAVSQTLLNWQHLDAETGLYNFVVAVNDATGAFDGAFGYIPTWHFDPALRASGHVWTALWKVVPGAGALLGLQLYAAIERETKFQSFCAFGINAEVEKLYLLLKHRVHSVGHVFRPLPAAQQPVVWRPAGRLDNRWAARAESAGGLPPMLRFQRSIAALPASQVPAAAYRPQKSQTYLVNRYERHPYYHYLFYTVEREGQTQAILVLRRVSPTPNPASEGGEQQALYPPPPQAGEGVGETCALRLIDVLGSLEACAGLAPALDDLLHQHHAEYIDARADGLPPSTWQAMGLRPVDTANGEIVPEYFEPFVQQNVNLRYALRQADPDAPYVLFKGDGDQDRPNIIITQP